MDIQMSWLVWDDNKLDGDLSCNQTTVLDIESRQTR